MKNITITEKKAGMSLRRIFLSPTESTKIYKGNVEKSRQQRSRHFAVLTYYEYAPRVKMAAALPVDGRVLARLGWAGQTTDVLNIPSH